MIRLLLTVILVILAGALYVYLHDLNPGLITIRTATTTSFQLSPVSLVLLSLAAGAVIVTFLVGVRETKHMIMNWRSSRLRRREEKVESLHRAGIHAFLSRRTAEAIDLFQKALTLDPNHTDSLLWLGNTYRYEQNYPEAIRLHRAARALAEKNVDVLLPLAKDLEGAKRFEEALQTLQEILKLDQTNLTALMRKRDLHVRLEQWSDALEAQHRLVKAALPDHDKRAEAAMLVAITYEVGRQLLGRGHPEKARRYFRGAIKRDKNFLPAYIGLGEALLREGKTKNAVEILEKVYRKTGNIILLHRLEEVYLEMGEPGEIIRVYQEAVQRNPQEPVLKFYLGKLYYRLEMIDEAFDLLSNLDGPPDQMSDLHKILANLYLRKQHMEEAVEELKKALGFKKRVIVPYVCTQCELESIEWSGRCRRCGQWNTFVVRPWVDPSSAATQSGDRAVETGSVPYQSLASPFETV